MINFIDIYIKINYCGQKIGNKFFPEKGLINIIGFEISFISSGIFIGLFGGVGLKIPLLGALIIGIHVLILRFYLDKLLRRKIDMEYLANYCKNQSRSKQILFMILSLLFFVICFILMIYIAKLIFFLM
ncbi:MAG: hypothetical protein ABFS12_03685 [Bacteroidota bacterium]